MAQFRMNVNISDSDFGRVMARVRKVNASAEAARVPATRAMAERARDQITENLAQPKSGVLWESPPLPPWYRLGRRPSGVSGGYPASQYGDLIRSIGINQTADGNANLQVGEGLYRRYAFWLEYGWHTKSGRFVKFPFVRPSVAEIPPAEWTEIVRRTIRNMGLG